MRGALVPIMAVAASCAPAHAAGGEPFAPIDRGPARAAGTVVLVHAGGWSGPSRDRQVAISSWPGSVFRAAGWRTQSIDYAAGKAGLSSVAGGLRDALARAPRGRVCVYAESSGGHLALLAAAAEPRLRCVMTLGAPTDFGAWRRDAVLGRRTTAATTYLQTAAVTFGGPDEAAWEPARVAGKIGARVLMMAQRDDQVVPMRGQIDAFRRGRRGTRVFFTPPGDYSDPSQRYLHGTLSPAARAALALRLRTFVALARR